MSAEEDAPECVFDLNMGIVRLFGGLCVPITTVLDRDGDWTDENEEAVFIVVRMPGDGLFVTYDLRDLEADDCLHNIQ